MRFKKCFAVASRIFKAAECISSVACILQEPLNSASKFIVTEY